MQYLVLFFILAVLDHIYFRCKFVREKGPAVWCGFPFVGILPVLLLPKRLYMPIYDWYLKTAPDVVITRHFYPVTIVKRRYVKELQKNDSCIHRISNALFETLGELCTGRQGWSLFDGPFPNADWRSSRKVNVMALHVLPKRRKFDKIAEVAKTFLEKIEERNGESWDFEDDLTFSKFQESANLNLGATFDSDDISGFIRDLKAVMTVAFGLFCVSVVIPLKSLFTLERWLPYSKRPSVFSRVYKELLWRLQFEKMAAVGGEAHDYVEALLRVRSPEVAHQNLRENAIFLVVASTMTTLHSTASALCHLALHPRFQEKILREYHEVVGSSKLTSDHLDDMHFLRAVVNEAVRISPPIPLVERYTRSRCQLGDIDIPAHMPLLVLMQSEVVDPKTYPDPEVFNPFRFLDGNMKLKDQVQAPFARGKRSCPGQDIALISIAVYVAEIVRHFELIPENPNAKVPGYDGAVFPSLPKIPIRFVRRPGAPAIEHVALKGGLTAIIRQVVDDDKKLNSNS
ncbi:cytochrome P450 71B22-like [Galendromus occidentalis]|uniref:Cytochrome P450 71B22-like n=1 Tax=Galendromus occidentalis TaxID=34638 RepID=A0AAJ6QYS9_9ACAR|nr:cytochrome P450 71B22-like [Galendromus occidentalis]